MLTFLGGPREHPGSARHKEIKTEVSRGSDAEKGQGSCDLPFLSLSPEPYIHKKTHTVPTVSLAPEAWSFGHKRQGIALNATPGFNQFRPARTHIPNQLPAMAPRQPQDLSPSLEEGRDCRAWLLVPG